MHGSNREQLDVCSGTEWDRSELGQLCGLLGNLDLCRWRSQPSPTPNRYEHDDHPRECWRNRDLR